MKALIFVLLFVALFGVALCQWEYPNTYVSPAGGAGPCNVESSPCSSACEAINSTEYDGTVHFQSGEYNISACTYFGPFYTDDRYFFLPFSFVCEGPAHSCKLSPGLTMDMRNYTWSYEVSYVGMSMQIKILTPDVSNNLHRFENCFLGPWWENSAAPEKWRLFETRTLDGTEWISLYHMNAILTNNVIYGMSETLVSGELETSFNIQFIGNEMRDSDIYMDARNPSDLLVSYTVGDAIFRASDNWVNSTGSYKKTSFVYFGYTANPSADVHYEVASIDFKFENDELSGFSTLAAAKADSLNIVFKNCSRLITVYVSFGFCDYWDSKTNCQDSILVFSDNTVISPDDIDGTLYFAGFDKVYVNDSNAFRNFKSVFVGDNIDFNSNMLEGIYGEASVSLVGPNIDVSDITCSQTVSSGSGGCLDIDQTISKAHDTASKTGRLVVQDSSFLESVARGNGGAINVAIDGSLLNGASNVIRNCSFKVPTSLASGGSIFLSTYGSTYNAVEDDYAYVIADVSIENCIFNLSSGEGSGGAIGMDASNNENVPRLLVSISDNKFIDLFASNGGAISFWNTDLLTLERNTFEGCNALTGAILFGVIRRYGSIESRGNFYDLYADENAAKTSFGRNYFTIIGDKNFEDIPSYDGNDNTSFCKFEGEAFRRSYRELKSSSTDEFDLFGEDDIYTAVDCAACGFGKAFAGKGSLRVNNGQCEECPSQLICSEEVGIATKANIWAGCLDPSNCNSSSALSSTKSIAYGVCVPGYCCEETCEFDTCPDHRGDFMCSRCAGGYTTTLQMTCEPEGSCKSSSAFMVLQLFFIPIVILFVILSECGSSGLFKVITNFFQIVPIFLTRASKSGLQDFVMVVAAPFNISFFTHFGKSSSCPFDNIAPSGVIALGMLSPLFYMIAFFSFVVFHFVLFAPLFVVFNPVRWLFVTVFHSGVASGKVTWKALVKQKIAKILNAMMSEFDEEQDERGDCKDSDAASASAAPGGGYFDEGVVEFDSDGIAARRKTTIGDAADGVVLVNDDDDDDDDDEEEEEESMQARLISKVSGQPPVVYSLVVKLAYTIIPSLRPWRWHFWNSYRFMLGFVTILLLSYRNFADATFRLMTCKSYDVGISPDSATTESRIYEDAALDCALWGWGWQIFLFLFSIFFIFPAPMMIGTLRLFLRSIYGNAILVSFGAHTQAVIDSFEKSYKSKCRWWESVSIGRKCVLLAIGGFSTNAYVRSVLLAIGSSFYLGMHVIVRPFKDPFAQLYETVSLGLLVVVSILGLRESVEIVRQIDLSTGSASLSIWIAFWSSLIMIGLLTFVLVGSATYRLIQFVSEIVHEVGKLTFARGKAIVKKNVDAPEPVKDGYTVVKALK